MRRFLASIACFFLLVPSSAMCAWVCESGPTTPASMTDHCDEKQAHSRTESKDPVDTAPPCAECGLHAASDRDPAIGADRIGAQDRDGSVVGLPPESFALRASRSVANRRPPRSDRSPPPRLAITHAPLLI